MSDYIDGLKRALDIIEMSHDADELEMSGNDQALLGASRAISEATQLILDEIEMTDQGL